MLKQYCFARKMFLILTLTHMVIFSCHGFFSSEELLPDDYNYLDSIWNFRADSYEVTAIAGVPGSKENMLTLPAGLDEVTGKGYLIADSFNHRVQLLDEEFENITTFYNLPAEYSPSYISVCGKSSILSLDKKRSEVIKIALDKSNVQIIGKGLGEGAGYLNEPSGLSCSEDGIIWIADTGNDRITAYTPDGKKAMHIGSRGRAPGFLMQPSGIAISPEGTVVVANTFNHRIDEFFPDGRWSRTIYERNSNHRFFMPGVIDIDPYGNIYTIDNSSGSVVKISREGNFITDLTLFGQDTPETMLMPDGICVSMDGSVIVTDTGNSRVLKWSADFFDKGRQALINGQAERAIVMLKKALDINPDNANAWYYIGRCYESQELVIDAVSAYRRSYSLQPSARAGILSYGRIRKLRLR